LEKQNWERFKSEVEKQISILSKSPNSLETFEEIQSLINGYYEKSKSVNIEALFHLEWKPENQREMSILSMAIYLWEFEGNFSFCVNFLCFLLMSNGHDLFDMEQKNYAKSFEDIESIGIRTKCIFLANHGFEIFDEKKNKELKELRTLRNNIAHYRFLTESDGKIKVQDSKGKWKEEAVILRHGDLLDYTNEMRNIFWDSLAS
jgi:hypothetical protein